MHVWMEYGEIPRSPWLRYGLVLSPLHGQPNLFKVDFEFEAALSLCEGVHNMGDMLHVRLG